MNPDPGRLRTFAPTFVGAFSVGLDRLRAVFADVDTRKPAEVEAFVRSTCRELFPDADQAFVGRAFQWAVQCFSGKFGDYQPIDAPYHDFEHTLQGTLCLARLLRGRQFARATPPLTRRMFELSLLAVLFHDTGYLKRGNDSQGTGAKYTPVHVQRGAEIAREFFSQHGFAERDIVSIQNMIRCTGMNTTLPAIPFHDDLERTAGYALATADLLGQMAAADYVEKLPVLFLEFAEAARSNDPRAARFAAFKRAEDLARDTPGFWANYVLPRIRKDFSGLYEYLNDPYPDGPNPYLQRIEANMAKLRGSATRS